MSKRSLKVYLSERARALREERPIQFAALKWVVIGLMVAGFTLLFLTIFAS
jgi:hypothetical protein